ncbi:MAG TPA: primosomal protein N', partial [Deinococcales bacterium]|nr:primosomal protein N' [Deinococcales bacterium]
NAREREAEWARVASGEARVVFATLTGLLAPIPDLDLIVVEEEGSDAYKLRGGSRAFLPDAARARAEAAGASLIVTGVAPAVESMALPGVTLAPPRARLLVVDYLAREEAALRNALPGQSARREAWPLSGDLRHALRQVAERGRQGVLIAPRRGYSAVLRCQECGWTPACPNCDVPVRLHQARRIMECHQCGYRHPLPERCPSCGSQDFIARGPGTEWIEHELKRFLPGFNVLRFDRDQRDDLATLYAGEPGIVIGTTAILGQPAPPDLAVIALSFADTFVNHPDFRAAERYHGLLRHLVQWHPTRAPLLVIQTFSGAHPVLTSLERGEPVNAYPLGELAARRRLGYPPFASMALVQVMARSLGDAERAANDAVAILRDRVARDPESPGEEPLAVLGPAPSPIPRQKGLYAYHVLVRAPSDASLGYRLFPLRQSRLGRVRVDVNPREFTDLVEENSAPAAV